MVDGHHGGVMVVVLERVVQVVYKQEVVPVLVHVPPMVEDNALEAQHKQGHVILIYPVQVIHDN